MIVVDVAVVEVEEEDVIGKVDAAIEAAFGDSR